LDIALALALPYAAQKGGAVLNFFGLIGIASWNIYSVRRLCQALHLYQKHFRHEFRIINCSTFSKVAWFAFGTTGIHGLDVILVIVFLGIIIAYIDASISFLEGTPLSTGSLQLDAMLISISIGVLSLVPDMSHLAKASACGLVVLAFAFVVIALYGDPINPIAIITSSTISWWPQDGLAGVSHWFGCIVFGFGVVPLTYNYYESMREPNQLTRATSFALYGVAMLYFLIGIGLLLIYPGIEMEGDVLEELLPNSGIAPTLVRVAMILVVMFTSPLLVFPCGLILEGKIRLFLGDDACSPQTLQIVVRMSICVICTAIGMSIPHFVFVLSFVGCCAIALISFIVPPLLHISLIIQYEDIRSRWIELFLDMVMLLWGFFAMVISSTYTFQKLQTN